MNWLFVMFTVRNKLPAALILVALLLSGSLLYAAELPPLTYGLTAIKEQQQAPDLSLIDLDEKMVSLDDFRGEVVVINFWATWCPPCRREMPSLQRLHQKTKAQGIRVLAVNVGEDIDTVFSFMGLIEPQPEFPLLFDTDATSLEAWQVKGLPTTYVVAPDGSLAYRAVGGREFDHPELIRQLKELIRTP